MVGRQSRHLRLHHLSVLLLSCISFCTLVAAMATSSNTRTILITGATDGIGRHTAGSLAADGNHLLVHGRRPKVGAELVDELLSKGAASATYFNADLSDLTQVEQLAKDVSSSGLKAIDVLINNAGVFDPPRPAKSQQGFDTTWAVNVMAPFLLTRRLLPLVAASSDPCPRIITTSSISQSWALPATNELFEITNRPKSAHAAYSDSKLGDRMMIVQLAKVLGAQNDSRLNRIKCLTMDPGTVNTKMLLAGWGACGISVRKADNTYALATNYGAAQESGSYSFGGSGSRDASNSQKLQELWSKLEETTGCTYDDIGSM